MIYTIEQLQSGEGLYVNRPTKAFSYDGGKTWHTCELSDIIRGEPTDVYTVPLRGGWDCRA